MTKLRPALFLLLTLIFISLSGSPVMGQPVTAPVPVVKPSPLTPIAAQINQQLQSLMGITTSSSAANAPANTTTGNNQPNAAASTTTGNNNGGEEITEPGETFGTQALSLVLS